GAAHETGKDRRDRAGPRVDRPPGESQRPGGRTGRARPRDRRSEAAREDSGDERCRDRRLSSTQDDLRSAVERAARRSEQRAHGAGAGRRAARPWLGHVASPSLQAQRDTCDYARNLLALTPTRETRVTRAIWATALRGLPRLPTLVRSLGLVAL